jgi:prepilin signal peptidase PulO-like enzyme (type II secretory pathway)
MNIWSGVAYATALVVLYTVARCRSALVSAKMLAGLVLAAPAAGVIVFGAINGSTVSVGLALALACLVVCAVSDLATGLIFDAVIATAACGIGLWSVIAQNVFLTGLGACICIAPLFALYGITRGRGIGLGDVKLGGIIGAGVGGVEALGAIGAAFVAGALYWAPLLIVRRARCSDRVPFAPFMAFGTLVLIAVHVVHGHG